MTILPPPPRPTGPGIVIIERCIGMAEGLVEGVGRAVAWLIPTMMLLISIIVCLRYGFNRGAVVLQETVLYLHATAFMLGFAYALKHKAHVSVDVFYSRFSPSAKAWVDLIGHSLFLVPVTLVIGLGSLGYVGDSWKILEKSAEAGGIPAVFLLKSLLPFSAALLLLQGLAAIATASLQLWRDKTTS